MGTLTKLIILALICGFLLFVLLKDKFSGKEKDKQKNNVPKRKKSNQPETVQDLLSFEDISENGLAKLKDGTYTATIELLQINQRLKNHSENAAIWAKFRTMLNSISVRQTELVQSQYLDIMDFVKDFADTADKVPNLTNELLQAKDDVLQGYRNFSEEKTREYRSYMIFRFNPRKDGIEKGLQTGSTILDNLLAAAKGKANEMDAEEEYELAKSVLDEVVDLSYQMLGSIGCKSIRLDKGGVLAMTFATLNRDLSGLQRIHDASNAHAFSELKQSLSPYMFEEQLRNESTQLEQEYDSFQEVAVTKEPKEEGVTS